MTDGFGNVECEGHPGRRVVKASKTAPPDCGHAHPFLIGRKPSPLPGIPQRNFDCNGNLRVRAQAGEVSP